jgi:MinD-like ATPase involved in chromosome partitioning or flagellar assembly
MSTIIFTSGAKGGTGKTTVARLLTTYLREQGLNPLLLDMDDESRTFSRFFPEAQQIEIKESFSHDILIKKILAGEKLIIADLKGGTGKHTLDWWLNLPFTELKDLRFICIASITSASDSVQSFLNWASALKNQVSYVVCLNAKDGGEFPDYNGSTEALSFRAKYKPIEIRIPRLHEKYVTELDRLNLTIAEVLEAGGKGVINGKDVGPELDCLLVRARLRSFQNDIYEQFKAVLAIINA